MTPPMAWVLVGLAAILTAAIVVVLLQLRRTLESAEKTLQTLETTGRHLNDTLGGVTATLARVNRAVDELERAAGRASTVLDGLSGIGDMVSRLKSSMGIVTSIGSALAGAVLTAVGFRSRGKGEDKAPAEADRHEAEAK
jgi:uncharacterized protein YoxC